MSLHQVGGTPTSLVRHLLRVHTTVNNTLSKPRLFFVVSGLAVSNEAFVDRFTVVVVVVVIFT